VSLTPEQLQLFVVELVAARHRWEHLVRHADDARVYEQLWDDDDVNAWVICWSEDQDTGFHDHDVSAASIAVIAGAVREDRLRLGSAPRSRVIGAGATFSVPPVAIHRVMHSGDAPAVTIHAYSPPLARTGVYRVGAGGELQRESLTLEEELRAEPSLELS
jgi:predicted metal-dependent enzyme (double-stranded beta helix superfamily)